MSLPGRRTPSGAELTANPMVRKLTFTGSTEVGAKLIAQCAPTVKKLSIELGGNAPFIVFDDADLDEAVEGAIATKFRNAGQTCVCANRLLVQDGVYDAFAAKLKVAVEALKVGNGMEPGVTQGPMINGAAVAKVEEHIADAVAGGARIVTGGKRHALGGNSFEPTLLVDVPKSAKLAREETFGPLAAVFRFATEEEAIAMANDTEFGLACVLLRARCGADFPRRRGAGIWDRGDQRGDHLDRGGAVWRREIVGSGARGLEIRDRGLSGDQVLSLGRAGRLRRRRDAP